MSAAAAPALTMGTPHAAHLQQTIQKELARLEYSDDDPVMAEYITVMLANAKTKQMITDELLDLIGDGFDPSFTDWLFLTAAGEPTRSSPPPAPATAAPAPPTAAAAAASPPPAAAPPPQGLSIAGSSSRLPPRAPAGAALFSRALSSSGPPTGPRNGNGLPSGGAGPGPLSRKRGPEDDTNGDAAARRRVSGPGGPNAGGGGGGSLLSRLGPNANAGPNAASAAGAQDTFQRKIDALTAAQGGDLLSSSSSSPSTGAAGLPGKPLLHPANNNGGRNNNRQPHPHPQQQQQQPFGLPAGQFHPGMLGPGGQAQGQMEMMAAMHGGGMGLGLQEMMMAQMQQMAQMQAQMAQMAAEAQAHSRPGPPPPSSSRRGPPPATNNSNGSNNPAYAPPPPTVPLPSKPTSTALCRFSVGCSLPTCPFSHPSPSATSDLALVLSTDPCPAQVGCADEDCSLSHVSPAQKAGGGGGKGKVECRFKEGCALRVEGKCPFAHRNKAGELEEGSGKGIGEGMALKDRVKGAGKAAVAGADAQTSGRACKFGARCTRANCHFAHPPSRPTPSSSSSSRASPYAKPTAAGGNRSTTFNVHAPAFEPKEKPHMSTRFGPLAAAQGGEKILPSASAAAAPAPASAGEGEDVPKESEGKGESASEPPAPKGVVPAQEAA